MACRGGEFDDGVYAFCIGLRSRFDRIRFKKVREGGAEAEIRGLAQVQMFLDGLSPMLITGVN